MTASDNLVERTRALLVNRPRPLTLQVIADQCGCSTRLLTLLASPSDKDFSVKRVQRIHDFLVRYVPVGR